MKQTLSDEKLIAVIRKVKGLLATANDHANENEAQTAFMMAQKLMIKYQIEIAQVEEKNSKVNIAKGQGTAHKTLFWYERHLAIIISENFRVKSYLNNLKKQHENRFKSAIMFYGLEADVKLAKEIYVLAMDALTYYTKSFIEEFYKENEIQRERSYTAKLKNSYMQVFLSGLEKKMDEQRFQLQEEFGLIVLTPAVVEENYEIFKGNFDGTNHYSIPSIDQIFAYATGYEQGNEIDYTRSTIDEEIEGMV